MNLLLWPMHELIQLKTRLWCTNTFLGYHSRICQHFSLTSQKMLFPWRIRKCGRLQHYTQIFHSAWSFLWAILIDIFANECNYVDIFSLKNIFFIWIITMFSTRFSRSGLTIWLSWFKYLLSNKLPSLLSPTNFQYSPDPWQTYRSIFLFLLVG